MIAYYAKLLNRSCGQHSDIVKAIEGLPQETLTQADPQGVHQNLRDGSQAPVSRAALHALEHGTLHRGQLQDLRQLYQDRRR